MATENYEVWKNGALQSSTPVTIPDSVANQRTVVTQALNAMANNRTFIALASPTNAEVVAQVKALSQQSNAIIRMLLGQFDATN